MAENAIRVYTENHFSGKGKKWVALTFFTGAHLLAENE